VVGNGRVKVLGRFPERVSKIHLPKLTRGKKKKGEIKIREKVLSDQIKIGFDRKEENREGPDTTLERKARLISTKGTEEHKG